MQRLSIGSVLGSTFSIYFSNFVFFTVIAAIISLPTFFMSIAFPYMEPGVGVPQFDWTAMALNTGVSILLNALITAVFMYAVVMNLRGLSISYGPAISNGISRAGFALLATIVSGIGIGLGLVLLVIPGLMLICYWYVVVPAATIEKSGPIDAISRSNYLTKGYRWQLFGIVLIFVVINWGIQFVTEGIVGFTADNPGDIYRTTMLMVYLTALPIVALQSIATAYSYAALTAEKDGTGLDELANVFD
ncbi:MAG: hypothetical protein AAF441_26265 [Pseudomonadota bacterium]